MTMDGKMEPVLFQRDLPECEFTEFDAEGFSSKVTGVIHRGGRAIGGVPLGGLGTGYVDLNTDGRLGKCTIFNNWPSPRDLNCPFLGLVLDGQLRVLALKPPERIKGSIDIEYWGHYPVADLQYKTDLPVDIGVRAFSPFVLGDSEISNTPALVMKVSLVNSGERNLSCRLAFCFPGPVRRDQEVFSRIPLDVKVDGLTGIELKHGRDSGYFIGLLNPEGRIGLGPALGMDGSPWEQLTDGVKTAPSDHPGSTITNDFTLAPLVQKRKTFVLAWFYPHFRDSDGKPHELRYLKRFKDAAQVAEFVAANNEGLLKRTLAWQQVIYGENYPIWLKDGLVNGLYSLAKNSLWVYSDRPDDWWGPTGFFTHSESFTGCAITETIVCRFHGHFPCLFFFPELELSTLKGFAHYQLRTGEIPFCFGTQTGLTRPFYYCQHPINSSQYVQMVYRYYLRTGDKDFLRDFFPSVKEAIQFAKTLDNDEDGLVNDHPHAPPGENWPANQFYDIWPWFGTSAYVSGIWLGTLKIAQAIGEALGDAEFVTECSSIFERGRSAFEQKLWNGKYYRLYNDPLNRRLSEVCLANQLMGEWCSRIVALGRIFPPEHVESALDSIGYLNFRGTESGIINGCLPNGTPDNSGTTHSSEIFVGESFCVAMTMLHNNRKEIGLEIARRMYESIALRHRTPWNQYCIISAANGSPVWGSDYYSNMVIWALPMAIDGQDIKTSSSEGSLIDRILRATRIMRPTAK